MKPSPPTKRPSKAQKPTANWLWLCPVVALVLIIASVSGGHLSYAGRVFVIGIVLFASMFWILLVTCDALGVRQQTRLERRKARRESAAKKNFDSLQAQLGKTGFETRLQNFARTKDGHESAGSEIKETELSASAMEFWERDAEYSRTPARPIGMIRYLLQRISKLVGPR
ncbi:hypothetical protein [Mariniblastus fucicola]|uniref:Uncharacterized protein n=1 Tax=Mariniblastus fucicola TaxID=980251 RepID=A0A5B9PB67_9BACT|nr:hypothetical protein [Mariniblastus fucicola]QEG23967.1 hypothetical protein MFFC18_38720 [Mariniblastus fucicola]